MTEVTGGGAPERPPSPSTLREAAGLLRAVLRLIDAGAMDATTPTAHAIRRRMEGAVIAAEQAAGSTLPKIVHEGSIHDTVL